MKKIVSCIVLCILACSALCLWGCQYTKSLEVIFQEPNLMVGAKVISSNNLLYPENAVDQKENSVLVLSSAKRGFVDYDLGEVKEFNTVVLKEKTDAVNLFRIYAYIGEKWEMIYEQDRILKYRLCYIDEVSARYIRLDFTEVRDKVALKEIELYNVESVPKDNFRVTQYLVMIDKDAQTGEITHQMADRIDDEGFSGNYNVVTDIMLIGCIRLNEVGEVNFGNVTEEEFATNLNDLRTIIGDRLVNIRATVFINPYKDNEQTREFLNQKREKINANLKQFVEKYKLYGIDYDWEYPENFRQWQAYSQIILDTAKYTKVSVALPTWGIQLTKEAKESIEIVNLMTYDLFDERGDHSNIFIGGLDGITKLVDAGFDKSQICLGIPTYARTIDRSGNAWPSLVNYKELAKWGNIVRDFQYTDIMDGTKVERINTAYFNGYAMSRDKTALSLQMGIGGVMLFRARCDAPYTYQYSVHRAVEDVISNW